MIFCQKGQIIPVNLFGDGCQVQGDGPVYERNVGREFRLLGINQDNDPGMGITLPYTLEKRDRLEKISHLGELDNENAIHPGAR